MQARFIAMMTDYNRTLELTDAAYNSAGASEEQFAKTMDSLDTKLNQLKNAWDSFVMTIANSTIIKTGIDLLTKLLTVINNLTSKMGALGGVVNALGIFGGLRLGNGILGGLLQTIAGAKSGDKINVSNLFKNIGSQFKKEPKKTDTQDKKTETESTDAGKKAPNNAAKGMEEATSSAVATAQKCAEQVGDAYNTTLETKGAEAKAIAKKAFDVDEFRQQHPEYDKFSDNELLRAQELSQQTEGKRNQNTTKSDAKLSNVVSTMRDDKQKALEEARLKAEADAKARQNEKATGQPISKKSVESAKQLVEADKKLVDSVEQASIAESKFEKQLYKISGAEKQAEEAAEQAGEQILISGEQAELSKEKYEKLQSTLNKVGGSMVAVGGLIMGLSQVLEDSGKISSDSADKMRTVGTAISGVGSALLMLNALELGKLVPYLKTIVGSLFGIGNAGSLAATGIGALVTSLAPLLGLAGVGAILVGIAYGIGSILRSTGAIVDEYYTPLSQYSDDLINNISAEEKYLNAANKRLEKTNQQLSEATTHYEELNNLLDSRSSALETLNQLEKGTTEYTRALIEANNQTKELLEQYPELKAGMSIDENGLINISEDALNDLVLQQQAGIETQNIASIVEEYNQAIASNLDKSTEEINGITIDRWRSLLGSNAELIKDLISRSSTMTREAFLEEMATLLPADATQEEKQILIDVALNEESYQQVQDKINDLLNSEESVDKQIKLDNLLASIPMDDAESQIALEQYLNTNEGIQALQERAAQRAADLVKNNYAGQNGALDTYAQMNSDQYYYDNQKLYDRSTGKEANVTQRQVQEGIVSSQYQQAAQDISGSKVGNITPDEMDALYNSTSGATEKMQELVQAIENGDKGLEQFKDNEQVLKGMAIEAANMTVKVQSLKKILQGIGTELGNMDENSEEFKRVLPSIEKELRNIFDLEADDDSVINDSFIKKYKNEIDALGQDGENALSNLGFAFLNAAAEANNAGASVEQVRSNLNLLDQIETDIDINGYATLDISQAKAMAAILDTDINGLAEKMAALGISVIPETTWKAKVQTAENSWVDPVTGTTHRTTSKSVVMEPTTTYKIVRNNASGTGGGGGNYSAPSSSGPSDSGSGGGGGSEEKNTETWKNSYDKFYNTLQKINEAIRQREKLERNYDRLLKKRNVTINEIRSNMQAQVDNLKQQQEYQKQIASGKLSQIQNLGNETYIDKDGNRSTYAAQGVTGYASYNSNTGLITINWDALNGVTNEDKGAAIEDYISRLEELVDAYEEAQDSYDEIEDQIQEIIDQNKEAYLDLESRLYDAIVQREQRVIDAYQELSDTISESNSKILDSLQESINLERQIRDNTKTEKNISDKEARLAYLRRDTSGANQLEIKQLEKELEDMRESYADTLVDQEIEKLQKTADDASEQRALQIEIMQAILDRNTENGAYWDEVNSILKNAYNSDGSFNNNSYLVELLGQTDAFKGMSEIGKFNWINELTQQFAQAMQGLEQWKMDTAKENKTLTLQNGTVLTLDSSGNWVDSSGNKYKNVSYNSQLGAYTGDKVATQSTTKTSSNTSSAQARSYPYGKASQTTGDISWGEVSGDVKAIQWALQQMGYNLGPDGIDGDFGNYTYNAVRAFQQNSGAAVDGIVGVETRSKFALYGYKTGGLSTQTGLAWLDGTPQKPELVLNAKDTENFIQLKDLLSSLNLNNLKNLLGKGQSSGDNYYSFNIEVEELGDNYDVDKLATKIEDIITEKSMYRNVNAIRFIR